MIALLMLPVGAELDPYRQMFSIGMVHAQLNGWH